MRFECEHSHQDSSSVCFLFSAVAEDANKQQRKVPSLHTTVGHDDGIGAGDGAGDPSIRFKESVTGLCIETRQGIGSTKWPQAAGQEAVL